MHAHKTEINYLDYNKKQVNILVKIVNFIPDQFYYQHLVNPRFPNGMKNFVQN